MGSRKNSSSGYNFLDSFIHSIDRMGESSSWITAFLFVAGGALSFYVGYTDNYMPSLLGGPLAVVIGFVIFYRAVTMNQKSRRKRKQQTASKRPVQVSDL
jgi:hypothetical protein